MTRRVVEWARRPAVDSFKWPLTWGDLLTIAAILVAGLALLVIFALTDG